MKRKSRSRWTAAIAIGTMLGSQLAAPLAFAHSSSTATPIKHVIVLIGENHSFDNVFATYQPKHRQTIQNLLSLGIINADGTPGPNSAAATQFAVTSLPSSYFISVSASNKSAYSPYLPAPHVSGAPSAQVSLTDIEANPTSVQPPIDDTVNDAQLATIEPSLESSALGLLRTGATGLSATGIDTRIANVTTLPNTVFQWTGPNLPYDS